MYFASQGTDADVVGIFSFSAGRRCFHSRAEPVRAGRSEQVEFPLLAIALVRAPVHIYMDFMALPNFARNAWATAREGGTNHGTINLAKESRTKRGCEYFHMHFILLFLAKRNVPWYFPPSRAVHIYVNIHTRVLFCSFWPKGTCHGTFLLLARWPTPFSQSLVRPWRPLYMTAVHSIGTAKTAFTIDCP